MKAELVRKTEIAKDRQDAPKTFICMEDIFFFLDMRTILSKNGPNFRLYTHTHTYNTNAIRQNFHLSIFFCTFLWYRILNACRCPYFCSSTFVSIWLPVYNFVFDIIIFLVMFPSNGLCCEK